MDARPAGIADEQVPPSRCGCPVARTAPPVIVARRFRTGRRARHQRYRSAPRGTWPSAGAIGHAGYLAAGFAAGQIVVANAICTENESSGGSNAVVDYLSYAAETAWQVNLVSLAAPYCVRGVSRAWKAKRFLVITFALRMICLSGFPSPCSQLKTLDGACQRTRRKHCRRRDCRNMVRSGSSAERLTTTSHAGHSERRNSENTRLL